MTPEGHIQLPEALEREAWIRACADHDQDPQDPDAFCFHTSADLRDLLNAERRKVLARHACP